MTKWTLGIIGGSGLYAIDGLQDRREETVETPWGAPSDKLVRGRIGDVELVFLPRHGKGHRLTPSTVPYRANIAALKMAGVTDVLSISACGSLKEQYVPGHFVAVDQFIDRTVARESTFFGPGMVAHVSMARPVCSRLSALAAGCCLSCWRRNAPRRHLSRHGRPAILVAGEVKALSPVGLRRDRHDGHARSQARPRG